MREVTVSAPAKINLTLDIVGRRADGYHLLSSVFQSIGLADTVTVRRAADGISLSLSEPSLPANERNTAYRAAALFTERFGGGARITIDKRIPMQAGLAGGSADAAGVLCALNELYGAPLSLPELCALGERIGADVPFCVTGGTALVTGIGEQIRPLDAMPDCALVIVKPSCGVSTKEAYRLVDDAVLKKRPDRTAMQTALANGDLKAIAQSVCNVFEEALALPEVTAALRDAAPFAPLGGAMSGSGSAVYLIFDDDAAAADCASALQNAERQTFLCRPEARGAYKIREE